MDIKLTIPYLQTLFNLVPAEREISALGCLREHPLRQLILDPKLENFVMNDTTPVLSSNQVQIAVRLITI